MLDFRSRILLEKAARDTGFEGETALLDQANGPYSDCGEGSAHGV